MDFETTTFYFPSSDGKTELYARCAVPEGPIVGILQISHGMCEYIDRYEEVFSYFARRGFLVCGHDHLGHGKSAKNDQLGFFAEKDGASCLVEDLHRMTLEIKSRYAPAPYFLLGHSMGSFIARAYLSKYGSELTGVILSGTGGPNPAAPMGIALANTISMVRGARHPSHTLDQMAFGSFNRRCQPRRTSKDWLSRDNAVVDRYLKDPYCMFTFSASAFRDLFTLNHQVNSRDWAQSIPQKLPIYLLSGDMDPVGDYGEGIRHVYRMLKKEGVYHITMRLYPGGRHEMFNEINRLQVFGDLYAWLCRRCENVQQSPEGPDAVLKAKDSEEL